MPLRLDENGLRIETFTEIFDRLVSGYRSIYGSDIIVTEDSPDGQRIAIEAKNQHDIQIALLELYNSFDPDFAVGARKISILKFAGLTPRPATRSVWDLQIESTVNQTLQENFTVADEQNQEWFLDSPVAINQGTNLVTFKAVLFGEVEGVIGSSIRQKTFNPNITNIAATNAATVGQQEESQLEINQRRNRSLLNPAYSVVGSLLVQLTDPQKTPGVVDVKIYENKSSLPDTQRGLEPHQIWCIVKGGELDDIAETIAKNTTGGTPLKGSIQINYDELIERTNGGTFNQVHVINFDRPNETPLFVRAEISPKTIGDVLPIEEIKNALSQEKFDIGQSAIATELYPIAYSVGTTFKLSNLQISIDGINFEDEAAAGLDVEFVIDELNINLIEI